MPVSGEVITDALNVSANSGSMQPENHYIGTNECISVRIRSMLNADYSRLGLRRDLRGLARRYVESARTVPLPRVLAGLSWSQWQRDRGGCHVWPDSGNAWTRFVV